MKTISKLTTLAATLLLCTAGFGQTTQYIQITVTDNSNLVNPQPINFLVSFSQSGLDSIDPGDNSNAMLNLSGSFAFPFTTTSSNNIITQEDSRPTLTAYRTVPMGFATKDTADIKIVTHVFSNNGDTTDQPKYVWLEKISTGEVWQLTTDTLKLALDVNNMYQTDYLLHTGPRVSIEKTDETCWDSDNGTIHVTNPNCTNWNLTLYQNSTSLFSTNVAGNDTVIANLDGGIYYAVTRVNNGTVLADSSKVKIFSPSQLTADFQVSDNYPMALSQVDFYDNSTNAASYLWTFGDGNTDTTSNPSYTYGISGSYEVTLTITDVNGCQSSTWDSVWVQSAPIAQQPHFLRSNNTTNNSDPSSSTQRLDNSNVTVSTGTQTIHVSYTGDEQEMTVEIMNMNGQQVASYVTRDAVNEFAVPAGGVYLVRISSPIATITKTVLVQ